jgi:hypothetical protein
LVGAEHKDGERGTKQAQHIQILRYFLQIRKITELKRKEKKEQNIETSKKEKKQTPNKLEQSHRNFITYIGSVAHRLQVEYIDDLDGIHRSNGNDERIVDVRVLDVILATQMLLLLERLAVSTDHE